MKFYVMVPSDIRTDVPIEVEVPDDAMYPRSAALVTAFGGATVWTEEEWEAANERLAIAVNEAIHRTLKQAREGKL